MKHYQKFSYKNKIHKEVPSFFNMSRGFNSFSTLEVSVKDLFGLSKAIVSHKIGRRQMKMKILIFNMTKRNQLFVLGGSKDQSKVGKNKS